MQKKQSSIEMVLDYLNWYEDNLLSELENELNPMHYIELKAKYDAIEDVQRTIRNNNWFEKEIEKEECRSE